jgi:ADP-heptose:LPS heptosyltransferase
MATPALASLASSFEGVEVDVATGPWTRPGFERNPHARRIVDSEAIIGGRRPPPAMMARVVRRLRTGRYDGALVLERGLWLALLPWLAGIPVRVGLDSGGRGITHTRPVDVAGVRHEAERFLDCARAIGAGRLVRRMTFEPGTDGQREAENALRAAGWQGEPYALLHPGGGTNPGMRLPTKRWPLARFAELGRGLGGNGLRAAVVCGPEEEELGSALADALPGSVRLGGQLSLAGVGATAASARLYVGNDSGPTHLALAVGTPTVAVFGPSDERRYGPFGEWPDGSPIGEAVADPPLGPNEATGAWPDRSVANVSVEAVRAATERVLARGERWRST